jgi:hypothetical protein
VITDAGAEIIRLVQLGELQNDPIRHPIRALSVHLEAHCRVTRPAARVLRSSSSCRPSRSKRGQWWATTTCVTSSIRSIAAHADEAERGLSMRDSRMGIVTGCGVDRRLGRLQDRAEQRSRTVRPRPAMRGVALTSPDAAQWVNLMRLNHIGEAGRVCGAQAGGLTCVISVWVKPPTVEQQSTAATTPSTYGQGSRYRVRLGAITRSIVPSGSRETGTSDETSG